MKSLIITYKVCFNFSPSNIFVLISVPGEVPLQLSNSQLKDTMDDFHLHGIEFPDLSNRLLDRHIA